MHDVASMVVGQQVQDRESSVLTHPHDGSVPSFKLYSPKQVLAASMLCAAAGVLLLSWNFNRLGQTRRAKIALVSAIAFIGGLVALCLGVPLQGRNPQSGFVLPAVIAGIIYQVALGLQAAPFRAHLAAGGLKESWWKTVAIGFGSLFGLLALLFLGFFLQTLAS